MRYNKRVTGTFVQHAEVMMIDPLDALTFSLHNNKGVYALLLGSGISSTAHIPTGWEITLELTRKLAQVQGDNCDTDPEAWYRTKFGEAPNYSKIIEGLAKSQPERSQLLRGYIEPTEEERQHGLKEPTIAHRAIARLVASGHIRVILTTNFDRLLEKALNDEGVVPTVISTTDAIAGARPPQHTQCTIVKLHGDYIDSRILNTPEELEKYPDELNAVVDRVLDEYGLIVCGWSAEWDTALRAAMERCSTHRFTTYWTVRRGSELKPVVADLVSLRRAETIEIESADSFFVGLAERVAVLEELDRPHPLSVKMLVARLKRYMGDYRDRISLRDLVMEEVTQLQAQTTVLDFPIWPSTDFTEELVAKRLRRYEALCERLQSVMVNGCYLSEPAQDALWVEVLERLAVKPPTPAGIAVNQIYEELTLYPALYLLYSGGLAALASERYHTLAALLTGGRATAPGRSIRQSLLLTINHLEVMSNAQHFLTDYKRAHFPASEYLHDTLRLTFKELVPDDMAFHEIFSRFEYLHDLVYADLYEKQKGYFKAKLLGRYVWRDMFYIDPAEDIVAKITHQISEMEEDWPPLRHGLFDKSLNRFFQVSGAVEARIKERRNQIA